MNDPVRVRTAATGLVSFAAAEEQMPLAATVRDGPEPGSLVNAARDGDLRSLRDSGRLALL